MSQRLQEEMRNHEVNFAQEMRNQSKVPSSSSSSTRGLREKLKTHPISSCQGKTNIERGRNRRGKSKTEEAKSAGRTREGEGVAGGLVTARLPEVVVRSSEVVETGGSLRSVSFSISTSCFNLTLVILASFCINLMNCYILGLIGSIAMLVPAFTTNLSLVWAILSFMTASAGVAIADVTIDACVTENSISHPSLAGDMQSLCGISSSIGQLVGFAISGVLVHIIGPQVKIILHIQHHNITKQLMANKSLYVCNLIYRVYLEF